MAIGGVANLESLPDHGGSNGNIGHEREGSIRDENSWYIQLRSLVQDVQTSKERKNNDECNNSKRRAEK